MGAKKMSDFENKQDVIASMAEMLMLNFRISPEKAYDVVESVLYPLKPLPFY
jgi:hypothetical protein